MPDNTPINTPFYLDKSLWVLILAPIFGFVSKKLGITLDPAEVVALVLPILAFIIGNKWKTTVLQKAQIQSAAAGAAVVTEADAAKALAGK